MNKHKRQLELEEDVIIVSLVKVKVRDERQLVKVWQGQSLCELFGELPQELKRDKDEIGKREKDNQPASIKDKLKNYDVRNVQVAIKKVNQLKEGDQMTNRFNGDGVVVNS